MYVYVCDQCESNVEVALLEGLRTYICPICSEVSFEKVHKKMVHMDSSVVSIEYCSENIRDAIDVGDRFFLEIIGFVKILEKNDFSLELEGPNGFLTSMTYEKFESLICKHSGIFF